MGGGPNGYEAGFKFVKSVMKEFSPSVQKSRGHRFLGTPWIRPRSLSRRTDAGDGFLPRGLCPLSEAPEPLFSASGAKRR